MGWLFEADAIDLLPVPPSDPGAVSLPVNEDWSEPADNKDAEIAFRTVIQTLPPRPGGGGGGMTTNSDKVDDIIIVGGPPRIEYPGFDPNPGGGGGGEGGDPGGGGNPTQPQPTDRPYDACEDREADTLANDINVEMQGKPDLSTREYGALIWRDDAGNLHRTSLVPGTNSEVNFPANSNDLGIDNYNRVVGMVHSHPSLVYLTETQQWVQASSGGIHGGDWRAADGWLQMHSISKSNFTMYVSYQGTMKEYDFHDNTNLALRSAYDSTGSQESGDYNPGATCP